MHEKPLLRGLGWDDASRMGVYGDKGHCVIALHGGPGAYGSAAPVAKGLSHEFSVLEPWQRAGGGIQLSVAVHVADLHRLITSRCRGERPALVGESWGAMLALAYAAKYPEHIGPLVLVGCGAFDARSRCEINKTRKDRIADWIRKHPEHIADLQLTYPEQIFKWHNVIDNFDCEEGCRDCPNAGAFDMKAYSETWDDMLRCQEKGIYPQSFFAITSPVVMLHGAYDPHPGKMIRDGLRRYIPHLEYHEFDKCGHSPVMEKHAKDRFFQVMSVWLKEKCKSMRP